MREHELKIWPEYFAAVRSGAKTFELRRDDRDYRVGDTLILNEFEPLNRGYTGQVERRVISYVLADSAFTMPGVVALGLASPSVPTPQAPDTEAPRARLWNMATLPCVGDTFSHDERPCAERIPTDVLSWCETCVLQATAALLSPAGAQGAQPCQCCREMQPCADGCRCKRGVSDAL